MPQLDAYADLIQRLDQFIRKYYLNQIIRGSLYTLALVGICFLAVSLLEGNFYFDKVGRKALFYCFIGLSAGALGYWVLLPAARYFRLGPVISHDKAALIIGDHFGEVQDKLLNVLQLGRTAQDHTAESLAASTGTSYDLLLASIDYKSSELSAVPFKRAIDLAENRRYLRYALPPLLLLLALLWAAPSLITDSTYRLLRNNQDFERPAPFHFVLPEGELSVLQFEDYVLEVSTDGNVVPAEAFLHIDGNAYAMKSEGQGKFSYRFENVAGSLPFHLQSGEVKSSDLELEVINKPHLLSFSIYADYPAYTGRQDELIDNLGDLSVPLGTQLRWTFEADHTENISLRFGPEAVRLDSAKRNASNSFLFERRALQSVPYTVITGNSYLPRADSMRYSLNVVPDQYPSISAETFTDSTQRNVLFFAGEASDDYGLSALRFVYTKTSAGKAQPEIITKDLGKPKGKSAVFDYQFDINSLNLKPGEELTYYFETLDNDGVQGAKSARTPVQSFRKKTLEEYEDSRDEQREEIEKKLREGIRESKALQEEMKRLREQLLQKKDLDWQTRQELEKLLEKHEELQKKMEQTREEFEEQQAEQEEFAEPDEELQEKQEKLEELFEKLENPEMEEMMQKIQEMLEKLRKDEALEMMEQMQSSQDEQEAKLERLEELYKQLEVEYEMQQAIEKLEELAQKQEELGQESSKKEDGAQNEEQQQKQEELNQEFKELTEKLDEVEKKNEELQRPKETGIEQSKENSIRQDQQQAKQQLEQQQNQQAGQKQKQAAQKMRQMSQDMKQAMQSGNQQQQQEDIKALRQLLENLVAISFTQEELLETFAKTEINTPRYVEEVQRQFKIKDDFRIVEDSLKALASRVVQIESFIMEKVADVKQQLGKTLDNLEERQVQEAANRQQRIMTDVNDLALMLSESMEQMQQQMASSMPGSQSCEKPGGQGQGKGGGGSSGSEPKDKMSQGQQSLKEQMERAMENMQKQAEGRKAGQQGSGGSPSSKEFAEMAAKQAALRKQLRDKQRKLQEQGKGDPQLQQLIEEMNKVETDLVNKKLTNEMLQRQQDILTRLLETEKAERQQGEDERRKSESAQEVARSLPPALEEYLRQRSSQTELYREASPELRPYYRQIVQRYLEDLKSK